MRKVFISYARQNRPDIDQLAEHLCVLGCETWLDSSLPGGQDWWQEILRRIADCDTFIAVISRAALNSTICKREFDWAEALGKPVLPVAVEPPPKALPRRFSIRQVVDYSDPPARDKAAIRLGGSLATLPPAPPLPHPLPESPEAPLSFWTGPIDLASQPGDLDHDQQHQILNQLEPALRSVDPEERRGSRPWAWKWWRGRAKPPLRYFVYVSDTKLEMLFEQIDPKLLRRLSVEAKVDLKLAGLTIRNAEQPTLTRMAKLNVVERYIDRHHEVGALQQPGTQYFRARMPVRWGWLDDYSYYQADPARLGNVAWHHQVV
jgi:TIR domain